MLRNTLAFVVLILLILLQTTVVSLLPLPPNLLLVLSLALFFSGFERKAAWAAFFGGVALDLFSFAPLGFNSFLLLLALLLLFLLHRLYPASLLGMVLVVFAVSFLYNLRGALLGSSFLLKLVFLGSLLDTLAFALTYRLIGSLAKGFFGERSYQLSFRDRL